MNYKNIATTVFTPLEFGTVGLTEQEAKEQYGESNIDCYIKGDIKYGAKRPNKNKSISLHSKKIEFIHPVSKLKILVEAKPPDESIWLN